MASAAAPSRPATPEQSRPLSSAPEGDMSLTADLENLQSDEQRRVLDVVAKVQKCGLKSVLSFPQLVVCGDQSAGKSSVLEALTGVPFPRRDGLCTRYATEISLRRALNNSLTIKVTPDENRPSNEREEINAFAESITDFEDLPRVIKLAMGTMGITKNLTSDHKSRAFARDVLSIVIEGPGRPQLTLVDIPGLIATDTRGVTKEDIKLVESITDSYINNPRTICLAVVAASNDYANQKILTKVRDVDPEGKRTLGIITKPDGLAPGCGLEKNFLELAQNQDIVFELGWHVLKNRKFEETHFTLLERNAAEDIFFNSSNFKILPKDNVGIDALRKRLSAVLFEHVKNELPQLRKDLNVTLRESQRQLNQLGIDRSTPAECKAYLSQLSQEYWAICKEAVNGQYENEYFLLDIDRTFDICSASTIRRTRAVVQSLNTKFADAIDRKGHKYSIDEDEDDEEIVSEETDPEIPQDKDSYGEGNDDTDDTSDDSGSKPQGLTREEALDWVREVLIRNRGKELIGNFNPLLIGELLREQATNWETMATDHVELVSDVCARFLKLLLHDKCVEDVENRLWAGHIEDALESRKKNAYEELEKIICEVRSHPINYNHYYTETVAKRREARLKTEVARCINSATSTDRQGNQTFQVTDAAAAAKLFSEKHEADMENFSCSEALDCLLAIYKVSQKVFVANITTQVIERHIVKGLESIFAPVVVNAMSDEAVEAIASEPLATRHKREFLTDRVEKLKNGRDIFKKVMGTS